MDLFFGIVVLLVIAWAVSGVFRKASAQSDDAATAEVAKQQFVSFLEEVEKTRSLPVVSDPEFITLPGEFLTLRHQGAKMLEYRVTRRSAGFGTRLKIGVVPLYLGTSKSVPVDELREVAQGTLYLTNQRLVFVGDARTYAVPLDDILSIDNGTDWIRVDSSRRGKPVMFSVANGYFWDGIFKLLVKLRLETPNIDKPPTFAPPSLSRGKGKIFDP